MQTATLTAQEMLAEILGKPVPQTKIEEIELAYLALMGDKNIRPNDKPDIYCAKARIVSEPTPSFPGGSATQSTQVKPI